MTTSVHLQVCDFDVYSSCLRFMSADAITVYIIGVGTASVFGRQNVPYKAVPFDGI